MVEEEKVKSWKIGAISGGVAGLVGAWLVSEYDFSLLFVIIIGALIGLAIGLIPKLVKKKNRG